MSKNIKDSLGDRMKGYENKSRFYLETKNPVIIRVDGKAFHSFTRGFDKPFDSVLMDTMQQTAKYLCENIMGCKLAYTQSDEISLLLVDYEREESQAWFDNNLQKMCSVSASMATMAFNKNFYENIPDQEEYGKYYTALEKGAMFDARAFVLPKDEVCNYFIWRQQDAIRNSIQMVAHCNFPQKEVHGKNCMELKEMLLEQKHVDWDSYAIFKQRGSCLTKEPYTLPDGTKRTHWVVDTAIPIFTEDRDYVNKHVSFQEDKRIDFSSNDNSPNLCGYYTIKRYFRLTKDGMDIVSQPVCLGTKEIEPCDCYGDKSKCSHKQEY